MKHNLTIAGLFTVILFSLYGCSTTEKQNMLSDQEKKDGWTLLFDGKTMNGWHLFNKGTIPQHGRSTADALYAILMQRRKTRGTW